MDNTFTLKEAIKIIWKWKVHITVLAIITCVASFILSSPPFFDPLFKSSAVIYPCNLETYSDESETEQMLQFLEATEIRDRLIADFNLYEHYEIDTAYAYKLTLMLDLFGQNVDFRKTRYESVEITVIDTDPVVAKNMVDSILSYYDQLIDKLHYVRFMELASVTKAKLDEFDLLFDEIEEEKRELALKYGVINSEMQSREVTKGLVERNNQISRTMFDNLKEATAKLEVLNNQIKGLNERYGLLEYEYKSALAEANKEIRFYIPVKEPFVADRKFKPKRSVVLALSLMFSVLLGMILAVVLEKRKELLGV